MFDKIPLSFYDPGKRLSSSLLTEQQKQDERYGKGNLPNAKCTIIGNVHLFDRPPVTEYARQNLNYMQGFTLFHYQAPSFTERKDYPSYLVAFTYEGKGSLTYREKTYALSKGDGFFIDCREMHFYKVSKGNWDVAILHLQGPQCDALQKQFLQSGSAVFHESTKGRFQQYLEQLLGLYSTPQLYRDWQVSSCITAMLTHLLLLSAGNTNTHAQIPQNIRYLIQYMDNNYTAHLTLDYLANFACMNKYHLSREFKKYTGFSPNDYLICLRINAAKNMLCKTTLPASKIAHTVGIHDINNFNALFKKKVGMTPIQFRNSESLFS